ncbi:hypothetical protein FJ365_01115 [Candidatus Dependentiae bacterium]|nr:hypothetical protein [Candidatus Dependentiae bacterium]
MMIARRNLLSILLMFLAACSGSVAQETTAYQSPFFDQQGKPSADLVTLLQQADVVCEKTRESIITATQKQWLRTAGMERYELTDKYANRMHEFKPLLQKLGLIDEVLPKYKEYDYALVHGATILVMRARLAFLAGLWQKGVRFKKLILLTGQRDLYPSEETSSSFTDKQDRFPMQPGWQVQPEEMPGTEDGAMQLIYDHLLMAPPMRQVPMVLINAPKQQQGDGSWRRPNTKDTIDCWLTKQPQPGSCLAVSNQPFNGYQDLVVRALLPAGFSLETVGFSVSPQYESVTMCLDSLARWLYSEQEYMRTLA